MRHYHSKEPNLLSEVVRFGAKSKLTRMGVYLAYIPIRDNELGAEDDHLSQQINVWSDADPLQASSFQTR